MASKVDEKFVQIDGTHRILRNHFQMGTWIDNAYPYAKPVKAKVLCSNGQRKITKKIGREPPGTFGLRRALIQYGEGITVSGVIGIWTPDGKLSASGKEGIVMFKANPNGVNAARYPVGWYHQQHA